MMPRTILTGLTLAPVLFAGACNINACNYETRFVSVTGTVTVAGATITMDALGFRQYNPDRPVSNSLSFRGTGERLPSPPASLVLLDDRDASRTVAALSFQGSAVSFAANSATDVAPSDRDYLFDLLHSGHAYVVLRLADGTTINVPLAVVNFEDWNRPDCN